MKSSLILSALALSFASSLYAHTDNLDWNKGWYIGAGLNSNAELLQQTAGSITPLGLSGDEIKLDSDNIGFDAYLGREINPYFAAELGYTFAGNVHYSAETAEIHTQSATVKEWNLHFVLLGRLPIGEYANLFLKGGSAWYYNTEKLENIIVPQINHTNEQGLALTYGFGAEIAWDQFVLRGEYIVISPASNVIDDFYITDTVGASLIYKFL
jgi:opacity protein-like surface antigen